MTSIVLWVEDLDRARVFYEKLLALTPYEISDTFVALGSSANEILLHLIPENYREGITATPSRREEVAIKPIFEVSSIANSREAVAETNGEVYAINREQTFQAAVYCDGFDPEGNVFQLRQVTG